MSFKYEKQFSKQQNIMNFLVRQPEGATLDQIGKEVFGESPAHRQVNQSYAIKFFDDLYVMLGDMILSGHIDSEDTRYFFKSAQTDVPMEGDF